MTEIERLMNPQDAIAAARRLKAKFKPRNHIVMADEKSNKFHGRQAILINGHRYPSLRAAARAHSTSPATVTKWLEIGKANYAED